MEPLEPIPVPWAHSDPLQSFFWFPSTFKIFNNLGNLLFAQRQPKSAQREGFCHGFATVVHEPSRPTDEGPDGVWILVADRISDQQKSNLLTRRLHLERIMHELSRSQSEDAKSPKERRERPGSNRRRPAWEYDCRLTTWNIAFLSISFWR